MSASAGESLVRTVHLAPLTVGRIRWGADIAIDCDYTDAYELNIPLSGSLEWELNGRPMHSTGGLGALFLPDRPCPITRWAADSDVLGVKVDRRLLEHHLALQAPDRSATGYGGPQLVDLRSPQGRSWIQYVRQCGEQFIDDSAVLDLDVFRQSFADSVVSSLATLLLSQVADVSGWRSPAPYVVTRVTDAVRDDPTRRWTSTDLCEVAGVGARRLQTVFREHLGTSPLAFVTTTRLERAHRLLRQGAPEATVTQVALDCGFSHLGRFSALFHGKYGVQPSAVLDEARRRRTRSCVQAVGGNATGGAIRPED
ncbi:AraC family transcriptional regulator [Kocuria sp. LUK]|nr:AraC family transcriptional regulator [Kocuria sp. LUK]